MSSFILYINGLQGYKTLIGLIGKTYDIEVVLPLNIDNNATLDLCSKHDITVHSRTKDIPLDVGRKFDFLVSSAFPYFIYPSECELARNEALNIHAAILPAYKGVHSGIWALINGEETLGVTLHRISEKFDDGDVLRIKTFPVDDDMSLNIIRLKLFSLVIDVIDDFLNDGVATEKNDVSTKSVYWRRRVKEDSQINWHCNSRSIFYFVRALSRDPLYAFSQYNSNEYIFKKIVEVENNNIVELLAGEVVVEGEDIYIGCGQFDVIQVIDYEFSAKKLQTGMVLH
mgnify:CR=1 FL=1